MVSITQKTQIKEPIHHHWRTQTDLSHTKTTRNQLLLKIPCEETLLDGDKAINEDLNTLNT